MQWVKKVAFQNWKSSHLCIHTVLAELTNRFRFIRQMKATGYFFVSSFETRLLLLLPWCKFFVLRRALANFKSVRWSTVSSLAIRKPITSQPFSFVVICSAVSILLLKLLLQLSTVSARHAGNRYTSSYLQVPRRLHRPLQNRMP